MVVLHQYGQGHLLSQRGDGAADPSDGGPSWHGAEPCRSGSSRRLRRAEGSAQRTGKASSAGGARPPTRRTGDPLRAERRRRDPRGAGRATPRRTTRANAVTIHLDTSALIDALTGPRRSLERLSAFVAEGHRVILSTIVLYEWLRGPRTTAELQVQRKCFRSSPVQPSCRPSRDALPQTPRPRGREVDLVAACALAQGAALWTLNRSCRPSRDALPADASPSGARGRAVAACALAQGAALWTLLRRLQRSARFRVDVGTGTGTGSHAAKPVLRPEKPFALPPATRERPKGWLVASDSLIHSFSTEGWLPSGVAMTVRWPLI